MAKKNFIRGFYPNFKLAECCEDDAFRPVLSFLYVKGDYVYATNARIAVRANMHDVSNLTDEEIALLNDKLIPYKTFEAIQKVEAIEVTSEGIVVKNDLSKTIYEVFSNNDADKLGYRFPDVEALMNERKDKFFRSERVGISPALLARLAKAMDAHINGVSLTYTGDCQAIIVRKRASSNDIIGIIMPIALDK